MTRNDKNAVVRLENISFSYDGSDNYVLRDVSFSLYNNEYVCIIGQNGSGKSTISKIITGLVRPAKGQLYVAGELITSKTVKKLRDNVGIIFQNPDNQFVGITAEDDIAFGLENRKYPRHVIRYTIDVVARLIGITNLLKLESQHLSGGQKQLVAIASVLAIKPHIFIFDESTSMLDPINREKIKILMVKLRQTKCTIVSITHDMEEVVNADRVIIINKGNLAKDGTPSEIFSNEAFLKELHLDVPIATQLKELLKDKVPNLSSSLVIEDVVKEICQKIK